MASARGPPLSGLTLKALREHAQVQNDPSLSFGDWVTQAGRVHKAALEADSKGQVEQAYVDYMKAASLLDIVMHHRDYHSVRLTKTPTGVACRETSRDIIGSIDRAKSLADTINQRTASSSSSPSKPDSPRSPTHGQFSSNRPVSGGLASRIKSLEAAGLASAGTGSTAASPTTSHGSGVFADRRGSVTESQGPPEAGPSQPRRPLPIPPSHAPRPPAAQSQESPKASFAAAAADLDAIVRSGSAPPELKPNQDPRGPVVTSPISTLPDDVPSVGQRSDMESVLRSLRSPSDFARDFPDLDVLEGSDRLPRLPTVPRAAPSKPEDRRPSLPPPPAAFDRLTGELANDTSLGAGLEDDEPPARSRSGTGSLDRHPAYPDFRSATEPQPPPQAPSRADGLARRAPPPIPQTSRPAGSTPPSSQHSPSRSRGSSTFVPTLPVGNSVLPSVLINYFRTAAEVRHETQVLFLDVRPRDAFEACRIKCKDIVCLEPVGLRPGTRSVDLEEGALVLSPTTERRLFLRRNTFDYVIIYDQHSTQLPTSMPYANDEKAKSLFTLYSAICMDEFVKPLKHPPMLLIGGLDAWVKAAGAGAIVGKGRLAKPDVPQSPKPKATPASDPARAMPNGRAPLREVAPNRHMAPDAPDRDSLEGRDPESRRPSDGSIDLKRQRRQATLDGSVPSANIARSIADLTLTPGQYGGSAYFNRAPSGNAGYSSPHGVAPPPLAMPQQSLQRPSPATRSDSFSRPYAANGAYGESRHELAHEPGYIGYVAPRRPVDYPQLSSTGMGMSSSMNGPGAPHHLSAPQLPPPAAAAGGNVAQYNRSAYGSNIAVNGRSQVNGQPMPSSADLHRRDASAVQDVYFSSSFDDGTIATTGLKNLGNTCYMNSTLQCLSATIPLARFFKDGSYRKCINRVNTLGTKGALAESVAELIRVLWSAQYTFVSPITFREAICRFAPSFRGSDQHDAQEFLTFLLDGLHEDLNLVIQKPKAVELTPEREAELESLPTQIASQREWDISKRRDNSVIVEIFQGQYRNRLQCLTCGTTSTTYNTFNTLTLPIPTGRGLNKVGLDQCLNFFMREEIMEKDNAWHCPKCKVPRRATKRLTLARLPPVLIIHLKRFSFKGPFSDKLETLVQYPAYGLDLTNHMPPPLPPGSEKYYPQPQRYPNSSNPSSRAFIYDLYGVTNHFGSLSSGHYTAFVRSQRDWLSIGDSRTSKADEGSVQSARSAYVLYYRRRM